MKKRAVKIKRTKYKRLRRAEPIRGIKPHGFYKPKKHPKPIFSAEPPIQYKERKKRDLKPGPMNPYSTYRPPHNKTQKPARIEPEKIYKPKVIIEWDYLRILLYVLLFIFTGGLIYLLWYLLG
ncbi:MAG: hypothetical protein RRY79_04580 [Clostridia bacterium]